MAIAQESIHEIDFCGVIQSAANHYFESHRDAMPFLEARLEGKGRARKRKDLRFYGKHDKLLLTGEVKLPGGPGAFDAKVVKDAQDKADDAGVQYFFTWDVNTFVLWDRSQWDKPMLERRVRAWALRPPVKSSTELARREVLDSIKEKFLPDLLRDLGEIVSGRRADWAQPLDELFLRSLESHLDWPVKLIREYLYNQSAKSKAFDRQLQDWMVSQDRTFVRSQPEEWLEAVDNAARTIAYIWANRLIFYKTLRARFSDLRRLDFSRSIKTAKQARDRLDDLFRKAVERSGDYETLLFPDEKDWASPLAFEPDGSIDA